MPTRTLGPTPTTRWYAIELSDHPDAAAVVEGMLNGPCWAYEGYLVARGPLPVLTDHPAVRRVLGPIPAPKKPRRANPRTGAMVRVTAGPAAGLVGRVTGRSQAVVTVEVPLRSRMTEIIVGPDDWERVE